MSIFVGFTSIYGAGNQEHKLWYCLTPNRVLYDLRRQALARRGLVGKLALWLHILLFQHWDRRCVDRFEAIVSQTQTVRGRVRKYYGKESCVIFAPIDIDSYGVSHQAGTYFLAVSRLFPEKRMLMIARAFAGMPSESLVMVGDGPQRKEIEALERLHSNIKLIGSVRERELVDLYKSCRATVYMPIDEDYGLVPLEGMAMGKPCIAADEGGCRETVIDGQTGYLVPPTVESLQAAVAKLTMTWGVSHADQCRRQAEKFSLQNCVNGWKSLLREVCDERG